MKMAEEEEQKVDGEERKAEEQKIEGEESKEEESIHRRSFLSASVFAIAGFIGMGFALPAAVYVVGPALKGGKAEDWIPLGSTSKVETGVPTLFKTTITRQSGWISNEDEIAVYVITEDGQNYTALSNVCTHLGCRVRWIVEKDTFFCPCHNGTFDKEGHVTGGPPPRPLDQYETKVVENTIFIKAG
jgi:menaquinol-cytochrome c reductase iron-sulfur subunit